MSARLFLVTDDDKIKIFSSSKVELFTDGRNTSGVEMFCGEYLNTQALIQTCCTVPHTAI